MAKQENFPGDTEVKTKHKIAIVCILAIIIGAVSGYTVNGFGNEKVIDEELKTFNEHGDETHLFHFQGDGFEHFFACPKDDEGCIEEVRELIKEKPEKLDSLDSICAELGIPREKIIKRNCSSEQNPFTTPLGDENTYVILKDSVNTEQ